MKFVYCTFEVEKLHKWHGAKKYPEVCYLAYIHRHLFHYRVAVEVMGNDREIEFIMLKHKLEKTVQGWGQSVGSCEMMADDLVKELDRMYPGRHCKVQVSEDGENGAEVET